MLKFMGANTSLTPLQAKILLEVSVVLINRFLAMLTHFLFFLMSFGLWLNSLIRYFRMTKLVLPI